MSKAYVVAGPAVIGNCFGHYGHSVPEGRFAVVSDGEYNNGGYGPSQAVRGLFRDEETAVRHALVADGDLTDDEVRQFAASVPDDWREATSARPRVVRGS